MDSMEIRKITLSSQMYTTRTCLLTPENCKPAFLNSRVSFSCRIQKSHQKLFLDKLLDSNSWNVLESGFHFLILHSKNCLRNNLLM